MIQARQYTFLVYSLFRTVSNPSLNQQNWQSTNSFNEFATKNADSTKQKSNWVWPR